MKLWRPVGLNEMALIFDSGMKAFPPRLPEQPIFYPVLNCHYATQIARGWNTKEAGGAGYVTSFEVPDSFNDRYERHIVGASTHEEWWVPAEELGEFNHAIRGHIVVDAGFFSRSFAGHIPDQFMLKGKDATQQFIALARHLDYSSFDVWFEIYTNRKAIYLHFLFWIQLGLEDIDITKEQRDKLIKFIEHRWAQSDIPVPLPVAKSSEQGREPDA
jgi:hypothetical protein